MNLNPEMRIGDAEREAAITALGEHFAAGRLTKEEFDERSAKAYAARTNADLRPLFVDLPGLQTRKTAKTQEEVRTERRELRRQKGWWATLPLAPIFLVIVGVVLLTHLPVVLILIALWLWWIGAFKRWSWRRQWVRDRYRERYGEWSQGWAGRGSCASRRW
jgi:Flp pilus assembly protein TadB